MKNIIYFWFVNESKMKGFLVKYFSLLFLFLVIGIDVLGNVSFQERSPIIGNVQFESFSDEVQISATPVDRHGNFERLLTLSHQQAPYGNSREYFSLSFFPIVQLAFHRTNFRVLRVVPYKCFSDLLGIRHIQGFYVFDLCKIVV